MEKKNIKSKSRVRDYGEVFTPDFIVEAMLDLVKQETERIDSRFLEPACGGGNFLIKILERKLNVVEKKYKTNQYDYERYSLIAVSGIYGIELLDDNVKETREKLYHYFFERYKKLYKNKINNLFLENIKFIIEKNIVQGDALTFKDKNGEAIIFAEWRAMNGIMIKRRDFTLESLVKAEASKKKEDLFEDVVDTDPSFSPQPIKEYTPVNFLKLKEQNENVE